MATAQKRGFHLPWGGDSRRDEPATNSDAADGPDAADAAASMEGGRGGDDLGSGPFGLAGAGAVAARTAEASPEAAEEVEANELREMLTPGSATDEAWPASDRGQSEDDSEVPAAPVKDAEPAAGPRRDNPLITGLVRAMRDAARTARDETLEALRTDATARAETLHTESAAATNELKKLAETDVAAIKDWSRAELARIREETDARIAARKAQLADEVDAEAAAAEVRLERLQAAVGTFEAEMDAFFERLFAEEDPARLAGLAEQMPSPPSLETAARSAPPRTSDSRLASPAEASWLDRLDADAAAAAEAEALAGLEHQTRVVVSGLPGVAAIAAFKGALVHIPGVSAVSVTAGEAGEVLFSVAHDRETDLREAIGALEPFRTQVIADDGTTLSLVARESAA